MSNAPKLLNDDGSASMATVLMMSHHAFRRDIERFAIALGKVAKGDTSKAAALVEEWRNYRNALHGHHQVEDVQVFPYLMNEHESLGPVIHQLAADHARIDPLLERGDHAFAGLPATQAALTVVSELTALLHQHLALEEAEVVPFLRGAKDFPPPSSAEEAGQYAEGFAWSYHGIHAHVLARVDAMLPSNLTSRLPAARAAFSARCERVWGSAKAGASQTSVPEG